VPTLNDLFKLEGRVAIVTGGSRGLGQEMAEGLAEAGASLMLCARRDEWLTPAVAAMRARGFTVDGMLCDVAKPGDVQAVVERTIAIYGKVDILINNAGVTWAAEPEDLPLDKWQKVVDVNLTGVFLCSQAVGRVMIGQGGGKIVNIASITGLRGQPPEELDSIAYSTTKGAVVAFTRDLAAKWARHGIAVNAIAPGWFPRTFPSRRSTGPATG